MNKLTRGWSPALARVTTTHPWLVLLIVLLITILAATVSGNLQVNLQMAKMLPESSHSAQAYLEITERYAEVNTMVALEGPRDDIVAFARELGPRMEQMRHFEFVQWRTPSKFVFDHGMMIQKPKDLRRMTGTFADPGMIGSFRGFNDDYEKEYTDDEGNLTRDEVNIAQSLLGTRRTLEVLYQNLSGDPDAAPMSEAVDAMIAGEPWALSLDRGMLVVSAAPKYKLMDQDSIIVMSSDLEALLNELRPQFPTVEANQTGTAPIQREEIEAISSNTMLLSLLALLAIYLLLAWNFRGAVMPLIALAPLIVGILWTMGAVFLLFSELNMFTAMIMLMLIGLGIDFSIHLISRFYEERASGASLLDATKVMLGSTGFGVLTGGLTTAAAFFVLIIGDTRGVREMGVGMALGVLLTLISIFVALPALLTIRERVVAWFRNKRGMEDTVIHSGAAKRGLPVIGAIAVASWKRPAVVLSIFAVLVALSIWGMFENKFLWDFLELEPKGLKSVELLREFPERYGVASEGAWLITDDIETSREMKEELRDLGPVGDVSAISDVITAPEWIDENQLILRDYRASMNATSRRITGSETDVEAFAEEIDRYWDNLDLMSNLAFQAGVDRVVKVIDGITGYDMESNSTDTSAVLPKLSALLETGVDSRTMHRVAQAWRVSMRDRLLSMSNPEPVTLDMVPLVIRAAHQPKDGAHEFLVHITPRDYLYNEAAYKRFMSQVQAVDPSITSTTQIGVEVMLGTLLDARDGALFALLLIALLLLFHFRGPEGLLAMIPLIGGTLFMMGTMYLIGMKYNYMNFIAMPVILGIGIDDGVHALHRWREEIGDPSARIRESFSFVGRAILLASLTTMIGFGSLAFYEMRAISSFGLLLLLGVGYCFIATITVLPAVMRFRKR